ncbi:MAG TPA: serine protease [bacterium]|nr:serine protease [bacterium]
MRKLFMGSSTRVLLLAIVFLGLVLHPFAVFAQDLPYVLGEDTVGGVEIKGPVRYAVPEEEILKNAVPAVVKLMVRLPQGDNTIGTGFFAGNGLLIATAHTLSGQPIATIKTQEGKSFDARVVASDPKVNLVVLRASEASIAYLPLGRAFQVSAGDELMAVTWPNIGSPRDVPLTIPRFLQFPNEMNVRKTKVLIARQKLSRATYWDTPQPAMVVDLVMRPEWSGSPLIDQHGDVVAVCMGAEYGKKDSNTSQQMPYTVSVEVFQGLPPVVLESASEPPAIPKQMSDEDRSRVMNLWRVWVMKAKVSKVPRIQMGGVEVPLTDKPEQIESFLVSQGGNEKPQVRQVAAGQAAQRATRASLVNWIFRPNPRIPFRVNVEYAVQDQSLQALPAPEGGGYAIPIGFVRRAFRSYLP